jgi:lipoprotein-anchoring transpeptidase ErfK/SrfK
VNKKILLIIIPALIITSGLFFVVGKKIFNARCSVNSPSAKVLVTQAHALEIKGNLLEAKLLYQKLVSDYPESVSVADWQKKAEDLNTKLLFSNKITPKSVAYKIKPGDTLNKIARAYKTTAELIMKSNNLSDSLIVPGREIKVWNTPFSILVSKSQNMLWVKSDEEVFKTYIVSTGKNNSSPVGTFRIINKLSNPTWFKAGAVVPASSPDNVLGTRWLGFDLAGYGIHGTTEPKELGKQVTQGCVRLQNSDVEELYSYIPVGTEVTIIN